MRMRWTTLLCFGVSMFSGCGEREFEVTRPVSLEARAKETVVFEGAGLDTVSKITMRDSKGKEIRLSIQKQEWSSLQIELPSDIGDYPIELRSPRATQRIPFRRKWFHRFEHSRPFVRVSGKDGVFCALDDAGDEYCFATVYYNWYEPGMFLQIPFRLSAMLGTKVAGISTSSPDLALDPSGAIRVVAAWDTMASGGDGILDYFADPTDITEVDGDSEAGCARDKIKRLQCWNIWFPIHWPWEVTGVSVYDTVLSAQEFPVFRVSGGDVCLLNPGKRLLCQRAPNSEFVDSLGDWIDIDLEGKGAGLALRGDGTVWDLPDTDHEADTTYADKRPGFKKVRGRLDSYCGALADGTLYCKDVFDPRATSSNLGEIPSLVTKVKDFTVDAGGVCAIDKADGSLVCWGGEFATFPRRRW